MGCGSSKASNDVIGPNGKRGSAHRINKNALNGNGSQKSNKNTPPKKKSAMEDAELLPGSVPETEESEIMPPPVSFSIPVENDNSLIRKHPPKRLQKLEDQQIQVSHDHLQEKQLNAEERRQKVLQERIQSSRRSANPVNRRMHQKDSGIQEQIEHEKNFGSPQNSKAESVLDF